MNKNISISIILGFSIFFTGMFVYTEGYEDIKSSVVEVLCLSCLKLDPVTQLEYIFETANSNHHPDFVLNNLTSGIVFLHYSKDACSGCDIILPAIKELFSVEYGKEDMFQKKLTFEENTVHYYYINTDHTTDEKQQSFKIYDKDHVEGLPMVTIITLNYDHGTIKPYYTSIYGTFGSKYDTLQKRYDFLTDIISESIGLWEENNAGYEP
ncbi:MAG: hypothetical protein DRN27_03670 [Thermoplasmata archaeon]|nr:MAG: hypothetical protein DRN27_03670 [Thermoplasmata archaeon]